MQTIEVTQKGRILTTVSSSTPKKENYFTKRLVRRVAKSAFTQAAKESMAIMGYNVIAVEGWIVKKYADGRIEKLNPIPNYHTNSNIVLD